MSIEEKYGNNKVDEDGAPPLTPRAAPPVAPPTAPRVSFAQPVVVQQPAQQVVYAQQPVQQPVVYAQPPVQQPVASPGVAQAHAPPAAAPATVALPVPAYKHKCYSGRTVVSGVILLISLLLAIIIGLFLAGNLPSTIPPKKIFSWDTAVALGLGGTAVALGGLGFIALWKSRSMRGNKV